MSELSDIAINLFRLLECKMGWKNTADKPLSYLYHSGLTSADFMLNALQLYSFLMIVEEEYNILIGKDDIDRIGFRTIQSIESIIKSKKDYSN